jgi:hypothetical protein
MILSFVFGLGFSVTTTSEHSRTVQCGRTKRWARSRRSRRFLPWAWPAYWTKGPESPLTHATQALSFSLESGSLCLNLTSGIQATPPTNNRGHRYQENPQADWRINHERCNGVRDRTPENIDYHPNRPAIRIALWREMPEPKQTLPNPTYRLATPS